MREALSAACDALSAAGVDSPRLDAELLLAEASGLARADLAAGPELPVGAAAARAFGAMIRRRVGREPVAHILGRRGFRHLELRSDRRALVPRPESELLVEVALELQPDSVLDVGTGSGAIALAIADELPDAEVVAIDTSPAALALARENAAALELAGRVSFELGSLPAPRAFDLLVANLPYVRDGEWPALAPEITRHEPREALLGGADGLDPIRGLVAALEGGSTSARAGLRCSALALEVGAGQAVEVAALLSAAGFEDVDARRDLAGIERVVVAIRRSAEDGAHPRAELAVSEVSLGGAGPAAAREALERTIGAGGVVLFPADGLYGLACDPLRADAIARIHAIKGRDEGKPAAVMYLSPLVMRELVAAMGEGTRAAVAALLPGPVTLVIANPEYRYPLACREDPERLGVRLIDGPLAGANVVLFQTSANRSGEEPPARFADVEPAIRDAVDLAIDGGELTGLPSTVVDLSAVESGGGWSVLREGALSRAGVEAALASTGR